MRDLDAELAALEKKNKELDAELAELNVAEEKRRAVREANKAARQKANDLRDKPEIARLEDEHGEVGKEIYVVHSDVGAVVVKRPRRTAFTYYQEQSAKKGTITEELNRQLIGPCLLYPDAKTFDAWVDELPFLLTRVADACAFLAGIKREDLEKK